MIFDPISRIQADGTYTLVCSEPGELKDHLRERHHGTFRVLYQPRQGSIMAHWRAVGELAYLEGDLLICLDEIALLCEGGKFKRDHAGTDDDEKTMLFKVLHLGRHRQVSMVAACQIPTDVAYRYRQLCTELRIFQTDDPDQVATLGKRIGKENSLRLPALREYAFLLWTDAGTVEVVEPKGA